MSQKPHLDENGVRIALCPQCGARMSNLGLDFKVPRQSDVEQWKKVEKLFATGIGFSSCGCSGPDPRPQKLREVDAFLRHQAELRAEWHRSMRIDQRAAELKTARCKRAKILAQRKARKMDVTI